MKKLLFAGCMALVLLSGRVEAALFGFDNITYNNAVDAAIGETQFFVEVNLYDPSTVLFNFTNIGPEDSSIASIYFDEGAPAFFSGLAFIDNSDPGVTFAAGATPVVLPGGAPYSFSNDYSFGAAPPPPQKGVNPGESLGIGFFLAPGQSFGDLLDGISAGSFRIGLHAIAFASGGSESFINEVTPIPEPNSLLLMGIGLAGLAGFRSKGNKK